MRKFITSPFGDEVDLDDPKTYDYLPKTEKELWKGIFERIGYALWYMDKMNQDAYPKELIPMENGNFRGASAIDHRKRINAMIDDFTVNYYEYIKNIEKMREFLFLFDDLTESMC